MALSFLFMAMTKDEVVKVVLFGDSITQAGVQPGGYITKMKEALAKQGIKDKYQLIGAGIGALAGGGVGLYMDNQEAKLRQRLEGTGVSVTRAGDRIILNMPSSITFDTDRAEVKPQFYDVLNSVAIVLAEFNKTLVDVTGHTDSDGSDGYNRDLSERRAGAVAEYLVAQGNNPKRFQVLGMGQNEPVAANTTAEGRAQNRRVEIRIVPLT